MKACDRIHCAVEHLIFNLQFVWSAISFRGPQVAFVINPAVGYPHTHPTNFDYAQVYW